jgi:hypothetical protein
VIPLLRNAWKSLTTDEMAARRWIRGLLVGFGVSGIGAVPYAPEKWRLWVLLGSGLSGCIGGLISVGEKNPPAPPAAP